MNLIILCAGYAERLQGIGNGLPKALLPVRGAPMLDHVISQTATHTALKSINIVTNAVHFNAFEHWLSESGRIASLPASLPVSLPVSTKLFNDGSSSPEEKLGAIGDLAWTIKAGRLQDDDLIVVAGDTLFSSSQEGFIDRSMSKPCTIGTFDTGDLNTVKKIASVETASDGRIIHFEEKPERPRTTIGGIALYYFRADCLPMVDQYIAEGNNPDQAGHLIGWLADRANVYGIPIEGDWIDIGTPEAYHSANFGAADR